jgi:hypothetical protein
VKRLFGSSLLLRCCDTQRFGSVCPAVELEMLLAWIRSSSWMDGIRPPVSHKSSRCSPRHRLYFLHNRFYLPNQPPPSQQSNQHPLKQHPTETFYVPQTFPMFFQSMGTRHRYTPKSNGRACMHECTKAQRPTTFSRKVNLKHVRWRLPAFASFVVCRTRTPVLRSRDVMYQI